MTGIPDLEEIHLILTYRCDAECDHCFVWSSPRSWATMTVKQVRSILDQAKEVPTVRTVYFEGGEPFLYYPVLVEGAKYAHELGFQVGVVTNAYWATDENDADLWLEPLRDKGIVDLSISSDDYHGKEQERQNVDRAVRAAERAGLPVSVLRIRDPVTSGPETIGEEDGGELYFRGRAAEKLVKGAQKQPWDSLTECPERPPHIKRLHVDGYGHLLFCQGVSIGNVWFRPLASIVEDFDPERHPIIGPLMRGGPVELARAGGVMPAEKYADACHLCYYIRGEMIAKRLFRGILRPLQAYGMENLD